jgi:hypothetical protein
MEAFVSFLRENLTCAADRNKCIEYIERNIATFNHLDLDYAHGMIDRWIEVGLFRGKLTLRNLDDTRPRQQHQNDKRPATSSTDELAVVKKQRILMH